MSCTWQPASEALQSSIKSELLCASRTFLHFGPDLSFGLSHPSFPLQLTNPHHAVPPTYRQEADQALQVRRAFVRNRVLKADFVPTALRRRHQSDRYAGVKEAWRKPKVLPDCFWLLVLLADKGHHLRVSTTEFEDVLRARPRCRAFYSWVCNAAQGVFESVLDHSKIGYGSNKRTKHLMPNGLKKLCVTTSASADISADGRKCHTHSLVSNPSQVDLLLMHNKTYAAEIAHNVSARKRISIIERARVLGVKVTNDKAKIRVEEA